MPFEQQPKLSDSRWGLLMKIEDCSDKLIVDGEPVYVLHESVFEALRDGHSIEGVSLGGFSLLKLLWGMMNFVKCRPNFSLALYRYPLGPARWGWSFCTIMDLEVGWQRVQIEQVVCTNCGWEGKIANPTEPSLYDTVQNPQNALANAWKLSRISCPKCNHELPRYAIWVEEKASDDECSFGEY